MLHLPLVLSRVDRRVNLDKKGKSRDTGDSPADDSTDAPEPAANTDDHIDAPEADNATPADGVSDLAPAPTPAGLVPSAAMPHKPSDRAVKYDLPEGVNVDDCAIFYLGGESLGLNNLLITHGRCAVSLQTRLVVLRCRWPKRREADQAGIGCRCGRTTRRRATAASSRPRRTGCSCAATPSLRRPRTPT